MTTITLMQRRPSVTVTRPSGPTITAIEVPGEQGEPGPQGLDGSAGVPELPYQIPGVASFTAAHGKPYRPAVTLLLPSGEEVETDVYHAPGQTTLVFAQPFTGTLYLR